MYYTTAPCEYEELNDLAVKFVSNLENRGIDLIIDVKEFWFTVIGAKDRDKMVLVFDKMIDIYYDMMKIKNDNNNIKCIKWIDEIKNISSMNSLEDVLKKINILVEYKDSIKFNVNSNLLMDSLIISIGGVNNGSRY